ncbi:hypothetical protein TrST_g3070 [Triparma strigata]|uniref:Uncharacterized protein n=1 Tax=Triparma strigata TaxID=1606541 RepID=A0A9W7EEB8_9STRA|nr:hypothetical protein TrST_g3070 [Triparma strigata]
MRLFKSSLSHLATVLSLFIFLNFPATSSFNLHFNLHLDSHRAPKPSLPAVLPPSLHPPLLTRGGSSNPPKSPLQTFISSRSSLQTNFPLKSLSELSLAVLLQLLAEYKIRSGLPGILLAFDYVLASVLTACAGKYYSMLRTASSSSSTWLSPLPLLPRLRLFLLTSQNLFSFGFLAGLTGYTLTTFITLFRSKILHQTISLKIVNPFHAAIYTGAFMAIVSNIRYTILQIKVEPFIEEYFSGKVMKGIIFGVRCANGFAGSWVAIWGMRYFNIQGK